MKQFKYLALTAVLVSASAPSMAAGTITFNGKVIDQTCSVAVAGSQNPTIILPTVATAQLNAAASVAGVTPFKIAVTGCAATGATLTPRLLGPQVSALGNLVNTATGAAATNVELQLLDAFPGSPILLAQAGITTLNNIMISAGQTEGEHEFAVQYYATGAATAGEVQSVVDYDVVYN